MEEEEGVEVEVGEYKLQGLVGRGSFAKVFRAAHRRTGERVAVKAIDRRRVERRVHEGILKEREILRSIDHPNILRLLDTIDVRAPDRSPLSLSLSQPHPPATELKQASKQARLRI
jgi:serine/threonine-protein kinase ULK/ATG1